MKDWNYIIVIDGWYNVHNDSDIKYMANNKRKKKLNGKQYCMSSSNIFKIQIMHSQNSKILN